MKIVVGLGNPGEKYEGTRHTVGFEVLDALLQNQKSKLRNSWLKSKSGWLEYAWVKQGEIDLELIRPLTYMNRSGDAVKYVIKKHPEISLSDLYVVHDDLDIQLGEFKIDFGKGPKVHNGVNSVERVLGTKEFWRVRVGIDGRLRQIPNSKFQMTNNDQIQNDQKPKPYMSGERYVLSKFTAEEREVIGGVVEKVAEELLRMIKNQ
jgi:PTH1 family peptidyl-tRNA hydrolase